MTNAQICINENLPPRRRRLSEFGSSLVLQAHTAATVVALWRQRHADRHYLRDLEDHVLSDLGLTRAEVEREARQPFWRPVDPHRAES